ncbi:MAG: NYN domain-containing protein [Desulfobaccales bacterium]
MDKIGIFIDGGHISKLSKKHFGTISIDFAKLANWIADGKEILRVYYYDCPPYQSKPPTPDERLLLSKKQKYFYNLNRLDRFEVREGKLECRGRDNLCKPIFEQKRIDILLAVDLIKLAFKKAISCAAILTGDSDYIPAIQVAKDEGVSIKLIHGPKKTYHDQLYDIADERRELTLAILSACKLK